MKTAATTVHVRKDRSDGCAFRASSAVSADVSAGGGAGGPGRRRSRTNRCLDVTGNSSADGARLQIWDCFAGANQRWTLP